MELPIRLERIVRLAETDEDVILEVLKKAEFAAMQKNNKLPTLTELLYHQTEDEILDIGDLLTNAAN
jgi:hypothetical protein